MRSKFAVEAQRERVAVLPSDIAPIRGMNLAPITHRVRAWPLPRTRKKDRAYAFRALGPSLGPITN